MKVFVLTLAVTSIVALSGPSNSPAVMSGARMDAPETPERISREHRGKIQDPHGDTALHRAVHSGHLDLVAEMLNRGWSPDTTTSDGWTVLMEAARSGQPDMVRELLAVGADPRRRDHGGTTALDAAFESGNEEVVVTLVQANRQAGGESTRKSRSRAPRRGVVRAAARSPR